MSTIREDEEDILDISEQTNRPTDDALHQQRVQAWHPILDPVWVIITLYILGIILVPVGYKISSMQDDVVELKKTYDEFVEDYNVNDTICGIGDNFNAGRVCDVSFTAPKDMNPPVLVYYELTNFHQNHRNYVNSRDDFQLFGQVGGQGKVQKDRCKPLNKLGNQTINPCGLIANTFFNDVFVLTDGEDANDDELFMDESGIAWESDLKYLFKQPDGFRSALCPDNGTDCSSSCCDDDDDGTVWTCYEEDKTPYQDPNGQCFKFFYPEEETTQYLYETYKGIISPLEGVTNEHFVVWMRVAMQPTFRKLYGWINQPILAGETVKFQITSNYVVTRFKGSKALILTTNNIFGGRNIYFGPSFTYVGFFCLAAGLFFTIKHLVWPRRLADRSYLHFKTD